MKKLFRIKRYFLIKVAEICYEIWELIADKHEDIAGLYDTVSMGIYVKNNHIATIETTNVPRKGELFWLSNPDKKDEYIIYEVEQVGYELIHVYLTARITLKKLGTGIY